MSTRQLKNGFLKDQAYLEIKDEIMNGNLTPGDFISENVLSEKLNMSRTPIRSALQRLEHDGIVRILPKQGIYICEISVKQINDVYEMRTSLETFAIKKLAHTIEKFQIEELKEILKQQYEQIELKDPNLFIEYDTIFHLKLMEFIDNKEMYNAFSSIEEKLTFYGKEIIKKNFERLKNSYEEHERILSELEKGNEEASIKEMENHLQNGRRVLLGN
ncbi:GntR family transcriptional regulator [Neobacillus cucumis]|uniref:GntR family transcriptional regulator n=1 Tax=Neobacillus cucumis TaxID=1740721 RepID=UPI002E248026|nr:GntR family transcriptional regulator [Neobacillus cucumis]